MSTRTSAGAAACDATPRRRWDRRRVRKITAALTGLALTMGAGVVATTLSPDHALAQQLPECPDPGDEPPPTGGFPEFTDSNVAVFAGGDFLATGGAAESEGLMVVLGDAQITKPSGTFNVGTVGAGSQIAPPPGGEMMIVGENLTVAAGNRLDIGANAVDDSGALLGGDLHVGGAITNNGTIETNNGSIVNPSNAADQYVPFADTISDVSGQLAGQVGRAGVGAGASVTFTGDGTTNTQVFSISAAQLAITSEFYFVDIERDADGAFSPIVINVTGGAANLTPNFVAINGTRVDDFSNPDFGNAASALLWNFVSATDVTIGGTSQVMGSILVPAADSSVGITASANGRVYVGGDLTMSGAGNELHNYPWRGDPAFDCMDMPPPETASAGFSKAITPGSFLDDLVNTDGRLARFHGTVTCELDEGAVHTESFTIRGSESFVMQGLPVDRECTVSEDPTLTDQGTDAGGYEPVDIGDWVWARPVITIDDEVTSTFTTSASEQREISITNTLLGTVDLTKEVTGAPDGADSYDVMWTATTPTGDPQDGYLVAGDGLGDTAPGTSTGTLTISDGETLAPVDGDGDPLVFPSGTQITFDEATPDEVPGYTWDGVTFAPSPATVGTDGTALTSATTTNAYTPENARFQIRKLIAGEGAAFVPSDTEFTVEYTLNDAPADQPLTILADGTIVNGPTLQHGDVVTFTETTRPDVDGVAWGTITIDPQTLTLDAEADPVTVTVTNEAVERTGTFQIRKALDGDGALFVPPDTEFTITYTVDGAPADEPLTILADGTIVNGSDGIPEGAVVEFTEATPDPIPGVTFDDVSIDPESITISGDDTPLVTVTNTFSPQEATFSIQKDVTGDGADLVPDDTEFTITYTVNGAPADEPLTILADGTVVDGPTLNHGDIITLSEEQPPVLPGVAWTSLSIEPETFTLDATTETVSVTVTNEASLRPARFTIRKLLTGDEAGLVPPDTEFTVDYTVNGEPADEPLTILGDGTVVESPALQHGDEVAFSEAALPDVPGIEWGTPVIEPEEVTLDSEAVSPAEVTVTNEAIPADTMFRIQKEVTGPMADLVPDDAAFTVNYAVDGAPAAEPLTVLADGTVVEGPVLSHGDVVTFSEGAMSQVPGVAWGTVTLEPQEITLDAEQEPPVLVTMTNEADPASATFQIRKALDGDGSSVITEDVEFTVEYAVNGEPADEPLTILGDEILVDGPVLQHGDVLTFTELTPADLPGVTFGDVTIDPETLTLDATLEEPAIVTVTNEVTLDDTSFRIQKLITGDGAPIVPADTEFTVDYAVNGVPAEQPLTILADGTVADSPALRHGERIVLSEAEPPELPGITWGEVAVEPEFFILDAEAATPVLGTVTNEAADSTEPEPAPPAGGLPTTGAGVALQAALGVGLLVLGGLALAYRRHRRPPS